MGGWVIRERRQLKMWVKYGNFLDRSRTHGVGRGPSGPTFVPTPVCRHSLLSADLCACVKALFSSKPNQYQMDFVYTVEFAWLKYDPHHPLSLSSILVYHIVEIDTGDMVASLAEWLHRTLKAVDLNVWTIHLLSLGTRRFEVMGALQDASFLRIVLDARGRCSLLSALRRPTSQTKECCWPAPECFCTPTAEVCARLLRAAPPGDAP